MPRKPKAVPKVAEYKPDRYAQAEAVTEAHQQDREQVGRMLRRTKNYPEEQYDWKKSESRNVIYSDARRLMREKKLSDKGKRLLAVRGQQPDEDRVERIEKAEFDLHLAKRKLKTKELKSQTKSDQGNP